VTNPSYQRKTEESVGSTLKLGMKKIPRFCNNGGIWDANLAVSSIWNRMGRVEGEIQTGPMNLDWTKPGPNNINACVCG